MDHLHNLLPFLYIMILIAGCTAGYKLGTIRLNCRVKMGAAEVEPYLTFKIPAIETPDENFYLRLNAATGGWEIQDADDGTWSGVYDEETWATAEWDEFWRSVAALRLKGNQAGTEFTLPSDPRPICIP